MSNSVKVNIAGFDYTLKTEQSEEFTLSLAKEIDSKIQEIKNANPFISTNQIAVLVALEYGADCKKAEQRAEAMRGDMKAYLEDAAAAQSERDLYKRELERLKEEAKQKNSQINLFAENDEKKD